MSFIAYPGDLIEYYTAYDSLDDGGYVMAYSGTGAKIAKAVSGAIPFAINYKSTEDPFTASSYVSGQKVSVFRDGYAKVKLYASNQAIVAGDAVGASLAGTVDLMPILTYLSGQATVGLVRTVGIALEDKAANAGGTIKVALRILGAKNI
jgi:hypothetical protein